MIRWVFFAISAAVAVVMLSAQDDALPEGKGRDVLGRMCTSCHGLEQVTSQRYSKKYWANVVDDMVSRGATGSDDDLKLVVSYLSRNFGKPVNINSATAKEIEDGLSFTSGEAEIVTKYRTDKGPQNATILRHAALHLLKQERTAKGDIQTKRLRAGWDNAYLLKVLSLSATALPSFV